MGICFGGTLSDVAQQQILISFSFELKGIKKV